MSQLYNGEQDYSPKIINDAAAALNLEPFELLMHPDRAMNYRKMHESALRIASDNPTPPSGPASNTPGTEARSGTHG